MSIPHKVGDVVEYVVAAGEVKRFRVLLEPQRCHFCGGEWTPMEHVDPPLRELPVLEHTMPMCPQFDRMGIVEYMKANRSRVAAS